MPRPLHLTTALPRGLREELGIKDRYGEKERNRGRPASRKAQRKEERQQKRHHGRGRGMNNKQQKAFDSDDEDESEEEVQDDEDSESEDERSAKPSKSQKAKTADEEHSRSKEPKISKAVRDKLDQDEKEIEALEKRLGIKGRKKLPKAFEEEGLADILGDLAEDSELEDSKKRKREGTDWLQSKRRKAQGLDLDEDDSEGDSEGEGSDGSSASDSEDLDLLEDDEDIESDEGLESEDGESDEFDGFEETGELSDTPKEKKTRENPYIAPVTKPTSTSKYIPPSMRAAAEGTSEDDVRLRRQAQGLLNKLSEANLISILSDVEKLYRENPRQSVTSTLTSLLMTLVADRASLQDTFVILHAGFIAGLYKLLGMDFGAIIIQNLVEMFDKSADERGPFTGKEHLNLMSLLSQLYNFHVIGSNLVFDYIRIFLQDITETNTELLLKIIRSKFLSSLLLFVDVFTNKYFL
jgi:nucleolar MIF4G domain-containing protein 1